MATRTDLTGHRRIGELLIDGGFINRHELQAALDEHASSSKPLGEVLARRGSISHDDRLAILRLQQLIAEHGVTPDPDGSLPEGLRLSLGQLLLDNGVIGSAELEDALRRHQSSGERLGACLVSQKAIGLERLGHWLGMQKRLVAAAMAAAVTVGTISHVGRQGVDGLLGTGGTSSDAVDVIPEISPQPAVPPDLLGLSESQKSSLEQFMPTAIAAATRYDVSAELVMAVIHTESHFDAQARSRRRAVGLMQVIPEFGGVEGVDWSEVLTARPSAAALIDPVFNIEVGTAYLARLQQHYFGEIAQPRLRTLVAAAAYNWGPTKVLKLFERHGQPADVRELKALLDSHAPGETRRYVRSVEQRMALYADYLAPIMKVARAAAEASDTLTPA